MSEDKVPYGFQRPQRRNNNYRNNNNTTPVDWEKRRYETAQRIMLTLIRDNDFINECKKPAEQSQILTDENLTETFGYPVDRNNITDELIVSNAITLADLFIKRLKNRNA